MAFVIIVGLVVAVISLLWIARRQDKDFKKLQNELVKKSKKGKK